MAEKYDDGKAIKEEVRDGETLGGGGDKSVGTISTSSHSVKHGINEAGVLTTRSELSKPAEKQINHHQPVHPAVLTIRVVQVGAGAGSHAPQANLATTIKSEPGSTGPELHQYQELPTKKEKMEEKECDINQYPALPTKEEEDEELAKKEAEVVMILTNMKAQRDAQEAIALLQAKRDRERELAREAENDKVAQSKLDWSENFRKRQAEDDAKSREWHAKRRRAQQTEDPAITASNLWLKDERARAAAAANGQAGRGVKVDKPKGPPKFKRVYNEPDSYDEESLHSSEEESSEDEPAKMGQGIPKHARGAGSGKPAENTKSHE